jgi:hypothetical protein
MKTKTEKRGVYAVRNYISEDKQLFQQVYFLPKGGPIPHGLEWVGIRHWNPRDCSSKGVSGFDVAEKPKELGEKKSHKVEVYHASYSVWCFSPEEVSDGKHIRNPELVAG